MNWNPFRRDHRLLVQKFPRMANGVPVAIRFTPDPAGARIYNIWQVPAGFYFYLITASLYQATAATNKMYLEYLPWGFGNYPIQSDNFTPGGIQFCGVQGASQATSSLTFLERSVIIPERAMIRLGTGITAGAVLNQIFVTMFGLQFPNDVPFP